MISSGNLQRCEASGEKQRKDEKKICRIIEKQSHWRGTKTEKGLEKTKDTSRPEGGRAIHEIRRKLDIYTWILEEKCGVNNLREKWGGRKMVEEERKE